MTCDGVYITRGNKDGCGDERFYSEMEYMRVVNLHNYGLKVPITPVK
jgi:hypothetical protein